MLTKILKKFVAFHILSLSGWVYLVIFPLFVKLKSAPDDSAGLIFVFLFIPLFLLLSVMSIVLELLLKIRVTNTFFLNNRIYSGFFFSGLFFLSFPVIWVEAIHKFSPYPFIVLSLLIFITFLLNLFLPQKPTK